VAYWLLQYSPRVFDLEEALQDGPIESWTVVRYLDETRAGDQFVFWRAGLPSRRGIEALGRITGRAVEGTPRPGPAPHWIDQEKAARHRYWLPIELTRVLDQPLLAIHLATDPRFAKAAILREYRSGNPFRLTDEQWAAITDQLPTPAFGRNPPWARDEIILALDLYLRRRPSIPGSDDPEVIELSNFLNRLPIHTVRPDLERFRNPNGVALKLANFTAIAHPGTGMAAGSRLDRAVWEELARDPAEVARLASAIRAAAAADDIPPVPEPDEEEIEGDEGRLLYRRHRVLERDPRIVKQRKAQAKAAGKLRCEVCTFDFAAVYGSRGEDFIEAHHIVPIAEAGIRKVRSGDLALVCSNCHSMLHRRPWCTPANLRATLRK
jgi:5-methylcytosine-specific restriction enzyme A